MVSIDNTGSHTDEHLFVNSDGTGRTGAYILLDMILNSINQGTREVNITGTLERLRDQRAKMVKSQVCAKNYIDKNPCSFDIVLHYFRRNLNSFLLVLWKMSTID
jgi:hypothetical protein